MRPFLTEEHRSELLTMGFGAVAFLPLEGVIRLGRTTAALFQQRRDCAGQSPTSNMLPSQQRMPNGFCGHSDVHTGGKNLLFYHSKDFVGPSVSFKMSNILQQCQITSPFVADAGSLWNCAASRVNAPSLFCFQWFGTTHRS